MFFSTCVLTCLLQDPASRLSEDDMYNIRAFNLKLDTNLGSRNFEKLRRSKLVPNLETLHRIQARVSFLSGIKPVSYTCCVNSCICYTWIHEKSDHCPYCNEPRNDSRNRPRNTFQYIPLIPRLVNLFLDSTTIRKMYYRAEYNPEPTGVADVFDGTHYRHLCREFVRVGMERLGHRFFELGTDIALALSTDGVGPFKSRKKTC
ncbi:hypothetical protein F5879DRAFT_804518, partial [Lentinula edodes]